MNNETAGRRNEVLARGERKSALAADVRLLDCPAREERAGNADDCEDDLLYVDVGVSVTSR